ncbi:MAG: hypothetical protein AAF203_05590 [Pseudomonadota bacterium]
MKTKNMAKLFGVLVLGGSMIAGAEDNIVPDGNAEAHCQVKLVVQKENNQGFLPKETTCLDEKSDEEVLEIVAEGKEPAETGGPICTTWGF